ncbi:MAG TPA: hypothetical protein VGL61_19390 [Kofleriaceae bacterium]|jgi:hypothetical protein
MALAPEPYLSACLEVLRHAIIQARFIAAERSERLSDLLDAVHNIPDLIQRWEQCDVRLLESFLEAFDDKWQGELRDTYVAALHK